MRIEELTLDKARTLSAKIDDAHHGGINYTDDELDIVNTLEAYKTVAIFLENIDVRDLFTTPERLLVAAANIQAGTNTFIKGRLALADWLAKQK